MKLNKSDILYKIIKANRKSFISRPARCAKADLTLAIRVPKKLLLLLLLLMILPINALFTEE
jgi:hypothetical protein